MKLRIDGDELVAEFQTERNWFGVTTAVIRIPLADIKRLIAEQRPAVGPVRIFEWKENSFHRMREHKRQPAAPSDETSAE